MISRRGFLGALLAAPAIVRAESLMKVVAPKQTIWTAYDPAVKGDFASAMGYYHREGNIVVVHNQVYLGDPQPTLSEIIAETIRKNKPQIVENVMRHNKLLALMNSRIDHANHGYEVIMEESMFK